MATAANSVMTAAANSVMTGAANSVMTGLDPVISTAWLLTGIASFANRYEQN
jgi:hypothetical protein